MNKTSPTYAGTGMTFEGSVRTVIRRTDLLITTLTLSESYEENIKQALVELEPKVLTDSHARRLNGAISRLRTRCEGYFNIFNDWDTPEETSIKRKLYARKIQISTGKEDKLKCAVQCNYIGMVEDFNEEDITEMVETQEPRARRSFCAGVSATQMRKGGARISKSALRLDKSYSMYQCIMRGIFHLVLIKGSKKWVFVSRDFKYEI